MGNGLMPSSCEGMRDEVANSSSDCSRLEQAVRVLLPLINSALVARLLPLATERRVSGRVHESATSDEALRQQTCWRQKVNTCSFCLTNGLTDCGLTAGLQHIAGGHSLYQSSEHDSELAPADRIMSRDDGSPSQRDFRRSRSQPASTPCRQLRRHDTAADAATR